MKKRAAEEAQKARLERERERKDMDPEKEDEEAKLTGEGQQDGKMKDLIMEERETKEDVAHDKKDGFKAGGNYF